MHVLSVIPARLGSTRLPNKPLRFLAGEPLIRRVVQRVLDLGIDTTVVVATDSRRVAGAVRGLGVDAVLTHAEYASGTDRVADVARRPEYRGADVILNVQGDEPFMATEAVTGALARVAGGDEIGTAAAPLNPRYASDPNRVRVTVDRRGHAVSFSRSPVPSSYHHIGLYAYCREALLQWVDADPVPQEVTERLEQLRPLALGMTIGVALLDEEAPFGIDTEEDLVLANASCRDGVPVSRRGEGTGMRVGV